MSSVERISSTDGADQSGPGPRERAWSEWGGLERCETWTPPPPRGSGRVVVVAPHPDDETLAAGGVLQLLGAAGWSLTVVLVTDGEASHAQWEPDGPDGLARVRRAEFDGALAALGLRDVEVIRLGIPDGAVRAEVIGLAAKFRPLLDDAALVLAPHPRDGHPDHDAAGEVAFGLARSRGIPAAAYGVWMWAWSLPGADEYGWRDAVGVPLSAEVLERKQQAIAQYRSQLEPRAGEDAILPPDVIDHHVRDVEVLFPMNGRLP
jgi:LmbE family N-acetylglucosaminyl deacetylase